MKKINFRLLQSALAVLVSSGAFSQATQTEMIFQPDACRGKDAHVLTISNIPSAADGNYATLEELVPTAWTFNGAPGYLRAFIDFTDLQSIPQGTTVTYAYLSLYGKPSSPTAPQGNQGANGCYVQRVTGSWAENTLTWNNQPTATATNQVALPASTSQWNYDVVDLNVTALVQDIINQPPANRYGFLIRLQNESYYRSIIFASSDYSVAARRPKLRLGLNFCSDSVARKSTQEGKIFTPDVVENGKLQSGISALVRTNLGANSVIVDYELANEGKTYIEIISIDGAVLKTLEVAGTVGKHTRTIPYDARILKNKMAVLVVKQGASKTANPFVISQ
ncbi:DNRLRE domain-containing protein [Longitalea luteola]|uniref:DNRLRE domain-containing protein n=1 Tax=Longitalea luteola TaxID=2812563 RepID=UPI001A97BFA9|nr:DNRLRE domain-containing protein [Longitalea luteola]